MNEELIKKLKEQIVSTFNLEDIIPEDIDTEAPLFGDEGLGLDSIDALELIILLEKEYGIKVSDPKKGKEIFASVGAMARFIESNQKD